jgi:small-conductance mechanosensitive channel
LNASILLANLDWEKLRVFWTDPSIQIQGGILLGLVLSVLLLTRLTKPPLKSLVENSNKEDWISKALIHLERLIAPIYLILGSLLSLIVIERLELAKENLFHPIASVATAWASYRLVSGFIKSKAWLRLVAVLAFGMAILHSFGHLAGPLQTTVEILKELDFGVGDRRISVLDILNGVVILLFLLWISSVIGSTGEKKIRKLHNLPPSLQVLLAKILRVLLVFLSFMVALSTIGLDFSSFAILGGAIGVGIGFGLQKVVSNLVSGLILLLDRSIKPGDVIEIDGTYGWINSLRARYASVITRDGKEHLIPNEDLIANKVVNWSFSDRNVRVRVPLGISYDSDPREAIRLCMDAVHSVGRALQDPEARCLVTGFGDNSIDLELRFWIDDPSNGVGNVRSAVMLAVWDKFKENGIGIPYPQRDIYIKKMPSDLNDFSGKENSKASQ